jgi:hypothetical protein
MTEITVTSGTLRKDSVGSLWLVSADVTSVGNGETWTVPHLRAIVAWALTPTTAQTSQVGGAVSGNTITIANAADSPGKIWAMGW